jgi:hypothetical protein
VEGRTGTRNPAALSGAQRGLVNITKLYSNEIDFIDSSGVGVHIIAAIYFGHFDSDVGFQAGI